MKSDAVNTCTQAEAEALLAPRVAAFNDAASRAEMLKLLMEDRAAGEIILAGLSGVPDTLTYEEARKAVREKHGCFRGDGAREEMVCLLVKDKNCGMRLMAGLKELPDPDKFTMPPPPMHDPEAGPTSPEERSAAGEALIKEVRKEGRFSDYTTAREEARRRNPSLFS